MTDIDDFLTWIRTELYEAELALHNGDPVLRRALWSRKEPVSVLGAWRAAQGQLEIDELFTSLAESFPDWFVIRLRAAGIRRDRRHGLHGRSGAHIGFG